MASARLIGYDTANGGEWLGRRGSAGYYYRGKAAAVTYRVTPPWLTLTLPGTLQSFDYTSQTPPAAYFLRLPDQSARTPEVCYFSAAVGSGVFNLAVSDSNWHTLSIYSIRPDASVRNQTISIIDPSTSSVLASHLIAAVPYSGIWSVFAFRGSIDLRVASNVAAGPTFQGVFFDDYAGHCLGGLSSDITGSYLG